MNPPNTPRARILGLSDTGIIWLCYALHALSLICGGITSVAALIINYIKRGDARQAPAGDREAALVLSHMNWQISTFWLTLALSLVTALATLLLALSVVGAVLIYPLWLGLLAWYAYRLIKGMLAINSGRGVV